VTATRSASSADRLLRWSLLASLTALVFGLFVLAVYCVVETIGNPGYSLVDAYWIGRLPWMGIAEALIVSGATACAVSGAFTVIWLGGSGLRALAIPALLAVGLWWFLSVAMTAMRFVPCPVGATCPAPPPDPWAYAYSVPMTAVLLLILPGVFLTVLAIVSRQRSQAAAPA